MAKIAFLGLGVMGYPMAGHLNKAGHDVKVWNRTASKAMAWAAEYDGAACETIADAVSEADFVMSCVGDDPDVDAVVSESLAHVRPGTILVDHTTASAKMARQCAEAATLKGCQFIDAPISGGEAGAVNGQLTIMCGGPEDAYQEAEPVMAVYAKAVKLMGPSGDGQTTKMVNQICIAGLVQALSEGLRFAQKAGMGPNDVVAAISKGAAQSWQMDNRTATMAADEFEHGFAVDWMRKDLRIAMETAAEVGAELPVTKLVDSYYAQIQKMGGGRWDTSSLIRLLD